MLWPYRMLGCLRLPAEWSDWACIFSQDGAAAPQICSRRKPTSFDIDMTPR